MPWLTCTHLQDPYVAPLGLQPAGGGGFTYSKQEEEIIRDIDRLVYSHTSHVQFFFDFHEAIYILTRYSV